VEARKKKLAHWKDTNRQGRKGGENKIVNVV
jgi:hypothetical protein